MRFQSRTARGVVAALLSVTFLWVLALSVSPQLHECVHADAGQAEHSCAVTLIASGNYENVTPQPVLVGERPIFSATVLQPLTTVTLSLFRGVALLEHAPPSYS